MKKADPAEKILSMVLARAKRRELAVADTQEWADRLRPHFQRVESGIQPADAFVLLQSSAAPVPTDNKPVVVTTGQEVEEMWRRGSKIQLEMNGLYVFAWGGCGCGDRAERLRRAAKKARKVINGVVQGLS